MPPQVHIEWIQMCPENLRANEPQTAIEMHHLMHNHTTFESTTAPGLRATSEKGLELSDGQSQPCTKNLRHESSDQAPAPECLELMVESTKREAEEAPPASVDSKNISAIPIDEESHVSDEKSEQDR